jgi:Fic family protein
MPITGFEKGQTRRAAGYSCHVPAYINRTYHVERAEWLPLLERAGMSIGHLNALTRIVPSVDHFIRLHIAREAADSSRIEGTTTTVMEALMQEDDLRPERRDDWREVNNYITALNVCLRELDSLPLSNRLLREGHRLLMQGVRGEHKMPGEFRRSQNWIGGSSPVDAVFVPPPWEEVANLMGDIELFLHNDETGLPVLVKAALSHYQFETIHPFLDGNGRTGRMLITLYLVATGYLSKPVLYLSSFFDKHRAAYYEQLTQLRSSGDPTKWVTFFLTGVEETARQSCDSIEKLLALRTDIEDRRLVQLGRRMHLGRTLLDRLYQRPVVTVEEVAEIIGKSLPTAYSLVEELQGLGILKEVTGMKRGREYLFEEYFAVMNA